MIQIRTSLLCLLFAIAYAAISTRPLNAVEMGETALDLEPTKEHPRNSEGSFITLKTGRILFLYTQFQDGARDNSPAKIVSIVSEDGGKSWSSQPQVVVENPGVENVMSVSLLRLKNGRIALFYLIKRNWLDCHPYVSFSDDEAKSWSAPKPMTDAPGYFVMNNDRVVQLHSGRLVAPVAFHRSKGNDPASSKSFDSRAIVQWLLSDDEGKTWREADSWWALPMPTRTGMQEPGVVELADGSLFSWARTDAGSQFVCNSFDQGKTWTAPVPSLLASPVSPASIKRLPGSDRLLAIYNDHSGRFPFPAGKRTPLVSAISSDGGMTWQQHKLIEDDPAGWYCYTAIHFVGDYVLLAYCAGDAKIGGLNRLRVRRIPLKLMTE